jgi:cyclophilin family peptidyl-prolyl cis-trans isomerase
MARTSEPDSATSQFFINLFDRNKMLDTAQGEGYTAFGKVTDGMDVVDKIAKVETNTGVLTDPEGKKGRAEDVPVKNVVIKSIKRKGK